MTKDEARALGFVYGTVSKLLPGYDKSGDKFIEAAAHPFAGLGAILSAAHKAHVITTEISGIIAEALDDVTAESAESAQVSVPEPYQPLPVQGSWQLGYYAAMSNKPYFDIQTRREAAGMTQVELADKLGVPQSTVSRWETKQVRPRPEMMARIKDAISGFER